MAQSEHHLIGYMGLVSAKELKNDEDNVCAQPPELVDLALKESLRKFSPATRFPPICCGCTRGGGSLRHGLSLISKGSSINVQPLEVKMSSSRSIRMCSVLLNRRLKGVQSGAAIVLNIHSGTYSAWFLIQIRPQRVESRTEFELQKKKSIRTPLQPNGRQECACILPRLTL